MKNVNKNIYLFLFAALFIIAGLFGPCSSDIFSTTLALLANIKNGRDYSIHNYTQRIEKISNEELNYHNQMMDLDSLKNNILGTRVVFKEDTTVIKADSGSLISNVERIEDSELENVALKIKELKSVSEENGANFLYCAAPAKELYEKAPANANNYFAEKYYKYLSCLKDNGIPTLNIDEVLQENKTIGEELFYYTDHHWTSRSGFIAAKGICEKLSDLYGFTFNESYTELSNYNVKKYEDWFLGSKGKKVGTYFTNHGADDFELITPVFETHMIEEQPFKEQVREGTFEETVLYMGNMEKDLYHKNTYATYSGGDFRLQIMKNLLNPQGKKVLLIRDSFACVVAPFLALQTSELHVCDMRNYDYYVGDKLNLKEYIRDIKPDYVIVLYNGVSQIEKSHGLYDFF